MGPDLVGSRRLYLGRVLPCLVAGDQKSLCGVCALCSPRACFPPVCMVSKPKPAPAPLSAKGAVKPVRQPTGPREPPAPAKFDQEYDFEKAQAEFAKLSVGHLCCGWVSSDVFRGLPSREACVSPRATRTSYERPRNAKGHIIGDAISTTLGVCARARRWRA